MRRSPNEIGAIAEIEVAAAFVREGHQVYAPLLDGHGRVDLLVVDGPTILRVQCKSAVMRGPEVVYFRTCSNTANVPRDYVDEVDVFGVYSPHLDRTYLVPIDGLGQRGCQLRLGPTRNGQQKGVRFAADYEIGARPVPSRGQPIPGR